MTFMEVDHLCKSHEGPLAMLVMKVNIKGLFGEIHEGPFGMVVTEDHLGW